MPMSKDIYLGDKTIKKHKEMDTVRQDGVTFGRKEGKLWQGWGPWKDFFWGQQSSVS